MPYHPTVLPTSADIENLLRFLPRLVAPDFEPIRTWHGGTPNEDGVITMPYPEYDPLVRELVAAASQECWCDYDYDPAESGKLLKDESYVAGATVEQLRPLLTYFVRGERFGDGHWAAMIEGGHVRRVLERLRELARTG